VEPGSKAGHYIHMHGNREMEGMGHSDDAMKLTKDVKEKGLSSGADLVGIISTESIDAIPKHWIEWEAKSYTRKSRDYIEDSKSVVVLGYHAWDDVHEIALLKDGTIEYPAYQRMSLYARRVQRLLEGLGYEAVMYPDLLSQKKMAQLAGLGSFGKNSLIINPKYGPWFRLQSVLTDAKLVQDKPFEEDLCGECDQCIKACPVDALSPYSVDPNRCIVGMYYPKHEIPSDIQMLFDQYMPKLTVNSRLMCMECQKACPYGRDERGLTFK